MATPGDQDVMIEEMATPPMATSDQEEEMRMSDSWQQLLVQVGSTPNSHERLVYLDTSLQGLLYAPSITDPSNLATHFHKDAKFDTATTFGGVGAFELKNRVIPNAGPTFPNPRHRHSRIVFQEPGKMGVFTVQGPKGNYAIYAKAPNDKRIYLRPTTTEVSGRPRKNRILGHLLSSDTDFKSSKNFVFLPKPLP